MILSGENCFLNEVYIYVLSKKAKQLGRPSGNRGATRVTCLCVHIVNWCINMRSLYSQSEKIEEQLMC